MYLKLAEGDKADCKAETIILRCTKVMVSNPVGVRLLSMFLSVHTDLSLMTALQRLRQ
jgi:hypothetical protein